MCSALQRIGPSCYAESGPGSMRAVQQVAQSYLLTCIKLGPGRPRVGVAQSGCLGSGFGRQLFHQERCKADLARGPRWLFSDSCTAVKRTLFDHLVGARKERGWEIEANGLCRL